MQITVLPHNTWSLSSSITTSAVKESKPDVGSSRNISDGSLIVSIAIHTLLICPPDKPLCKTDPIKLSATLVSCNSSKSYSTLLSNSTPFNPTFIYAANLILSLGVNVPISTSSWVT